MQHTLIMLVNDYLNRVKRGDAEFPPLLVKEMNDNLTEHFTKPQEERKFKLYMSNLGHPLCQLQHGAMGTPKNTANQAVNDLPFVVGNMVEQYLFMVMKGAMPGKVETNIEVHLNMGGTDRRGFLDVEIKGIDSETDGIYDVKVMSPNNFRKFDRGFMSLYEKDPYGYVVQGALYERAHGVPFRGWIVMDKVGGSLTVCDVPVNWKTKYQPEAIRLAANNFSAVTNGDPFKKCFEDEEELWYGKATGNRVLPYECNYCDYRLSCWPDTIYRTNPLSKAKAGKYINYTQFVEKEDG